MKLVIRITNKRKVVVIESNEEEDEGSAEGSEANKDEEPDGGMCHSQLETPRACISRGRKTYLRQPHHQKLPFCLRTQELSLRNDPKYILDRLDELLQPPTHYSTRTLFSSASTACLTPSSQGMETDENESGLDLSMSEVEQQVRDAIRNSIGSVGGSRKSRGSAGGLTGPRGWVEDAEVRVVEGDEDEFDDSFLDGQGEERVEEAVALRSSTGGVAIDASTNWITNASRQPSRVYLRYLKWLYQNQILLLGAGKLISQPPPFIREHLNQMGIQLDVMDRRNACSTYNLRLEEGRRVAAALDFFASPIDVDIRLDGEEVRKQIDQTKGDRGEGEKEKCIWNPPSLFKSTLPLSNMANTVECIFMSFILVVFLVLQRQMYILLGNKEQFCTYLVNVEAEDGTESALSSRTPSSGILDVLDSPTFNRSHRICCSYNLLPTFKTIEDESSQCLDKIFDMFSEKEKKKVAEITEAYTQSSWFRVREHADRQLAHRAAVSKFFATYSKYDLTSPEHVKAFIFA
ncbi:hypothetical protein D9758_016745 [Tetrapyrgos nigripes]|uniref:NADH dehydrogenase [ubiquinone] 1 alpha subcomplex assembly factor 3 n=1 Tax=Tetrapyrgos nigripes TaxID=182062 RepID=A0A8H5C9U8_9AGAR|nr:hypothetical protein D9758_016745 [Tetrapyrgos nigripes]